LACGFGGAAAQRIVKSKRSAPRAHLRHRPWSSVCIASSTCRLKKRCQAPSGFIAVKPIAALQGMDQGRLDPMICVDEI